MSEEFLETQGFEDFVPEPRVKPENKKAAILVIVVLLIIGGIIGVLAARIWDPLWNPFRPSPELVLAQATGNMFGLKSYHAETTVKLNVTNLDTKETLKTILQISSDTDRFDEKKPKSHSVFTVNIGCLLYTSPSPRD